jgi:L-ascorbate metabolism protein UlaG (beta-lactamase superfamily)
MQVEWYGQSAFRLAAPEATVFIDPFGDVSGLASRGLRFEYPAIKGVDAFLERMPSVHRLDSPRFDLSELPSAEGPLVVVPSAP